MNPAHPANMGSSAPRSSPEVAGFELKGKSDLPDPRTHAWRPDLADVSLAGRVIASHYATPVARSLHRDARLRVEPQADAPVILELSAGAPFLLLDSRGDWAWGYGGEERRVGYISVEALV